MASGIDWSFMLDLLLVVAWWRVIGSISGHLDMSCMSLLFCMSEEILFFSLSERIVRADASF
jgi:hypothetical protein